LPALAELAGPDQAAERLLAGESFEPLPCVVGLHHDQESPSAELLIVAVVPAVFTGYEHVPNMLLQVLRA
jgi:hypothetical protein